MGGSTNLSMHWKVRGGGGGAGQYIKTLKFEEKKLRGALPAPQLIWCCRIWVQHPSHNVYITS